MRVTQSNEAYVRLYIVKVLLQYQPLEKVNNKKMHKIKPTLFFHRI